MAVQRTKTIKNKHAGPKGGSSGASSSSSSSSSKKSGGGAGRRSASDGFSKPKSKGTKKGPVVSQQVKERNRLLSLIKRPKKKLYTDKELGIPELNMVTPVGVEKPKGQKKGKVFVDDKESMSTILSLVQAEKEGHIESKMIKARQMEEIREARKLEAEKKAEEKKAKLEDAKDSLRKKRKRSNSNNKGGKEDDNLKMISSTGTRAGKAKKKVAFA